VISNGRRAFSTSLRSMTIGLGQPETIYEVPE
jgi:hypothetical protein